MASREKWCRHYLKVCFFDSVLTILGLTVFQTQIEARNTGKIYAVWPSTCWWFVFLGFLTPLLGFVLFLFDLIRSLELYLTIEPNEWGARSPERNEDEEEKSFVLDGPTFSSGLLKITGCIEVFLVLASFTTTMFYPGTCIRDLSDFAAFLLCLASFSKLLHTIRLFSGIKFNKELRTK